MGYLPNLVGKVIAERVNESWELQLLKHKLRSHIELLTTDENAISRIEELLQAILIQAQTESKFDGFLAGLEFVADDR
ncbi:MAG TPA: hypothetical protein PKA10_04140 [Selenomonadales bacterium]|nr:hypothetical protein [Selenomonadales bacterium]